MMGMRAETWTITLVLDLPQSSVYIAEVGFDEWYRIVQSKYFSLNFSKGGICIQ
jgi:hypothetical protein